MIVTADAASTNATAHRMLTHAASQLAGVFIVLVCGLILALIVGYRSGAARRCRAWRG